MIYGISQEGAARCAEPAKFRLIVGLLFALQAPVIDFFAIKAPVAADAEGGQLTLSEQAIDGAGMHLQIIGKIPHGQGWGGRQNSLHGFTPLPFDAKLRQ